MISKKNVAVLEAIAGRLQMVDAGCFAIGSDPEHWVGFGKHPRFNTVKCVLTLGNYSDRVFVTMTDADEERVGRILAAIEYYGRPGAHQLEVSDSMPLTDPFALENGRVAAMLMEPNVFPGGKELLGGIDIDARHCDVVGVIFLDLEEYELRRREGAVALIDVFEAKRRDCITFDAEQAAD